MNLKQYILEESRQHFNVVDEKENIMELKKVEGYTPFPYIHNEKTMEDYVIFDMPSSFQINILDFSDGATTSITYDSQFDLYYSEKTKEEPVIGYAHKHNFYRLTFVVDGALHLLLEDDYHYVNPASFVFTNTNVKQKQDRSDAFTVIHICFKYDFIKDLSLFNTKQSNLGGLHDFFLQSKSNFVDYLYFQPMNTENTKVEEILVNLFNEMKNKNIGYLEMSRLYLQRLLYYIQKPSDYLCMHTSFSKSQERSVFEETLKYIIDVKRKVSREEIGLALNYNGNYISRIFLKHAGITLAKYIRDISLSHAAHLLLNTDLSIKEIVNRIGYENKTVFYKNFKEKYGVNPGEYRTK